MFGPVPKSVWSRLMVPNDDNCICLDTNCVYVDTGSLRILIDTGVGNCLTQRQREFYNFRDEDALVRNLHNRDVDPARIDWVILTHLHFDHVGGCLSKAGDGAISPTFPRARLAVQQTEWEDAQSSRAELRSAYDQRFMKALDENYEIRLLDGHQSVVEGVSVYLSGGHTRGHQLVTVDHPGGNILCIADLCPTVHHLNPLWTMPYDQYPLTVKREKRRTFVENNDERIKYIFPHDPRVPVATVQCSADEKLAYQSAEL